MRFIPSSPGRSRMNINTDTESISSAREQPILSRDLLAFILKRDQIILLGGLVVVAGLSWVYMIHVAWGMNDFANGHANATLPSVHSWSAWDFANAVVMWGIMMLAMMLPALSPWVLALGEVTRERDTRSVPLPKAGAFLLGYGTVWLAYSILAAASQWLLQWVALLSHNWMTMSPILAGAVLIIAGIYQWTPLRDACMSHCRSPFGFFLSNWAEGSRGAYTMGVRHGLYCVGCCWALMAALFALGIMSVVWMAAVAALITLEKTLPWRRIALRATATALLVLGVLVFAAPSTIPGLQTPGNAPMHTTMDS